jgi:hypothetical protein
MSKTSRFFGEKFLLGKNSAEMVFLGHKKAEFQV